MVRLINLYNRFFQWLIEGTDIRHLKEYGEVHRLIAAMAITSVLMWSYTINSFLCSDNPALKIIALTCTIIHFLSPLVYKVVKSTKVAARVFIFAGLCFQSTHAFFTGGFESNTIIWLSVLPLISGIILEKTELIIWTFVTIGCVFLLYFLDEYSYDVMSVAGDEWSQMNIALGYIAINFVLFYSYSYFREKQEAQLNQKNESIKKLLRIVSHDIANPVAIIAGNTNLLKRRIDKGQHDKLLKHCDSISKSTNMIIEILEHTIRLEALDTGKATLELKSVSLNEIIENSLFVFRDKINEKQIHVEYDFDGNQQTQITAEPISVKNQIFNNLFSNSIKFLGDEGQISIEVTRGELKTEVKYQDNGVGMPKEILENLFRSDVKTSRAGVNGEKGTGFGMPILKATLDEMGAQINVESVPKTDDSTDHGTTFSISFLS